VISVFVRQGVVEIEGHSLLLNMKCMQSIVLKVRHVYKSVHTELEFERTVQNRTHEHRCTGMTSHGQKRKKMSSEVPSAMQHSAMY
jgi:hypothetical protein